MIKSIIFDFDGVITTSEGIGKKILMRVLKEENLLDKITFDENRKITNNGKQFRPGTSIHDILKIVFPDKGDYLFDKWYEKFDKKFLEDTQLLSGVYDTINLFHKKELKLFIVSTKYKSLIVKALKHFKLDNCFEFIIGRETIEPPKPNITPFNFLKEKFGINEKETLYVGDTHTDELFAQNCNLKFIFFESNVEKSIANNYHKKITKFSELIGIVDELNLEN